MQLLGAQFLPGEVMEACEVIDALVGGSRSSDLARVDSPAATWKYQLSRPIGPGVSATCCIIVRTDDWLSYRWGCARRDFPSAYSHVTQLVALHDLRTWSHEWCRERDVFCRAVQILLCVPYARLIQSPPDEPLRR